MGKGDASLANVGVKRAKVGVATQRSLFGEQDPLGEVSDDGVNGAAASAILTASEESIARDPLIRVGTSSFTATGWDKAFYPPGLRQPEWLSYYATKYDTVEIDSTFYGTPALTTVQKWAAKTPPGFLFAAKVPQVITHEKVLIDCDAELTEYLRAMDALGDKLGPLLFQFGHFSERTFRTQADFLTVLQPFLRKLPKGYRFAVEIRNKQWLDGRFLGMLRDNSVALALIDHSWIPRPWETKQQLDWATTDWTYVRWLGDRKEIEAVTQNQWNKTVVNRERDLRDWAAVFRQFVGRNLKIYAYANNHYAGYGPGTIKLFWEVYDKK